MKTRFGATAGACAPPPAHTPPLCLGPHLQPLPWGTLPCGAREFFPLRSLVHQRPPPHQARPRRQGQHLSVTSAKSPVSFFSCSIFKMFYFNSSVVNARRAPSFGPTIPGLPRRACRTAGLSSLGRTGALVPNTDGPVRFLVCEETYFKEPSRIIMRGRQVQIRRAGQWPGHSGRLSGTALRPTSSFPGKPQLSALKSFN